MTNRFLLQSLTLSAAFAVSSTSHAALTYYSTAASFAAVAASTGVDTYTGFSIIQPTTSPVTRTAGAYTYNAAASTSSFYGAGTTANPWLSTNIATDSTTFSGFSPSVKSIGANFFGSDISGLFLAGDITLTALDSLGATSTQTVTGATTSSFSGFTTTGTLTSLVVTSVLGAVPLWPTVDNLTLGQVVVVPEPETYALMLAGLGIVGASARRRRG